jgi:carboxypeptidase Taq
MFINNYTLLENEYLKISHINNALSILSWDIATNLPLGSAESRTHEIVTLTSLVHSMIKSNTLKDLIDKAKEEIKNLDKWQIANIKEIEKKVLYANCIDDELQKNFVAATTKSELVWREARANNDYNLFKPHLQQVLNYTKEIAKARASVFNSTEYDALIDMYDPDRKSIEIKEIYSVLKKNIPELIRKVVEKQKSEKLLISDDKVSIDIQKIIGRRIMQQMGFDLTKGRLDESTHPFCGGTANDVRITTRYEPHNFISGLMAIIHETGHALYEQNLPDLYKNQLVGRAKGMAFHESQSLFMEMQVARSKEFIEFLAKLLRDEFAFKGEVYSAENLYKKVTRVKPGFIRVDADEVTYPMHVILRFEIEELLIKGDLTLDELPSFWNDKMVEYLNIKPATDSNGCLQDIHWSGGAFGYFPAYTNGAIIAGMLMSKAKAINFSINQDFLKGEFAEVNKFLNDNLRSFGSLKSSSDLLKSATDEEKINPHIFIKYLEQKYL